LGPGEGGLANPHSNSLGKGDGIDQGETFVGGDNVRGTSRQWRLSGGKVD